MPISRSFPTSQGARIVAALISAAVILVDFWLVWRGNVSFLGFRSIPPLVAIAAYILLGRGDLASVGLRLWPVQGLRYWLKATLVIALAVGAFIAIVGLVLVRTGRPLRIHPISPDDMLPAFVDMCLLYPLVEEAIYRLGFCTGAVSLLGPKCTIAASGLTFGALHVLYGNPGPDNLIAGYFLAWAYLKSGTIVVPVVLHSLGNLCALAMHFATWYWQHG